MGSRRAAPRGTTHAAPGGHSGHYSGVFYTSRERHDTLRCWAVGPDAPPHSLGDPRSQVAPGHCHQQRRVGGCPTGGFGTTLGSEPGNSITHRIRWSVGPSSRLPPGVAEKARRHLHTWGEPRGPGPEEAQEALPLLDPEQSGSSSPRVVTAQTPGRPPGTGTVPLLAGVRERPEPGARASGGGCLQRWRPGSCDHALDGGQQRAQVLGQSQQACAFITTRQARACPPAPGRAHLVPLAPAFISPDVLKTPFILSWRGCLCQPGKDPFSK